ncbi:uncharacterized protein [Watersipora subatra]|uniref:uncharacterized protein n=1 Tax=Watersipora subatra TaxID=2589382 RepID=UPI00355C8413
MRILKKFISGDARRCVEGFLLDDSLNSYTEARKLLQERFGKKVNIARHLKKKLKDWPKIGNRDGQALQQFADFLSHLLSAKQTVSHLNSLDESESNEEMLEKLPDWLKIKWKYQIRKYEKDHDDYPPFSVFKEFINEEASTANILGTKESTRSDKFSELNRRANLKQLQTLQASTSKDRKSMTTEQSTKYCKKCDQYNHHTAQCNLLVKATYEEALQFFKENHLCFHCGKGNHKHNECSNRWKCKVCKRSHPDCLHKSRSDWESEKPQQYNKTEKIPVAQSSQASPKDSTQPSKEHIVAMAKQPNQIGLLSMLLPVTILSGNGREMTVYALLDNGSDTTNITENAVDQIKLKSYGEPEKVTICTLAGEETRYRKKYKFSIKGTGPAADSSSFSIVALEQKTIPHNKNQIPTEKLDLAVDMLIGRDNSHLLAPHESIIADASEPFAMRTVLGWTLCGGNPSADALPSSCFATQNDEFHDINDQRKMSQNDMTFLKILESGTKTTDDGSLSLPLPFTTTPYMPNNKSQALKRLKQLIKRLQGDAILKSEYFKFMQDMINSGHAELVPDGSTPEGQTWYLPHFAVFHPKKRSLRVVFDASARYGNRSLNEELLSGPDQMNSLRGILLRFRRELIAISCDIQKKFHNFKVDEKDRNYLRFLWVEADLQTVKEYRMTVHLFGATSSPGVATFALNKVAADSSDKYPEAAKFIINDFYVDDGITSVKTEQEATDLIENAVSICKKVNLCLHKFLSNNRNVLETIPNSEVSKNLQGLDIYKDKLPSERTLGLEWCTDSDTFTFTNNKTEKPPTKRGILSSVSQLYDPIGLIAPFTLQGKILMQQSCKEDKSWDQTVSPDLQEKWRKWNDGFDQLQNIKIPRCLKPAGFGEALRSELHYFGDASLQGFGACAYLRIINKEQRVHVAPISAKSRVVPVKGLTIPRLELQAAVEAVRLANFIRTELQTHIDQEYFWSDSTTTLGYIKNSDTQFRMFTANRVNEIRESSNPNQWYHISGVENPADIVSRGASAEQLAASNWYKGPAFLQQLTIDEQVKSDKDYQETLKNDPEVKNLKTALMAKSTSESFIETISKKFSSWRRFVRAIANFQSILRNKSLKKVLKLSVEQMQDAETAIVRLLQQTTYLQEIKKLAAGKQINKDSKIRSLTPFLDESGLLRVNSRSTSILTFQEKRPLIIPKTDLAKLLISHFHQSTHHSGTNVTVSAVRQAGYWVTGATALARSIVFNCIKCRLQRSRPTEQIMGLLPEERTTPSPPFTHVGLDVFGHFLVKERRSEIKRWGIVFTCTYTRGIHIELIDNLTTDSFLQALRRFQAIRGQVRTIFCDNGTNFVGGRNQLERDLLEMKDSRAKQFLLDNKIQFKMNTPSASHQGGLWERQIRTIRSILNSMTPKYSGRLTTESLQTAFMEITAAINNRPLSTISATDTEPVITINHLLTGKSQNILPPPGEFTSDELYGRHMYRKTQQLAQEFWEMWNSQYLSKIETRSKWQHPQPNLKVGDVVLIIDENQPRNLWSTGKIVALHFGADSRVRKATVMLATPDLDAKGKPIDNRKVIDRPVQKLILLVSP